MAEETSGQEKTEAPTQRRLQDARDKGDVAKSMEIPSAAVLLAALLTIYMAGGYILERIFAMLRDYLGNLHVIEITTGNMATIAKGGMLHAAYIVGPVMLAVILAALVANYAQVGVLFSTEKLMPKISKIDPIKGFGNLFSKQTFANLLKSIAKLLIVGFIAFYEVRKAMPGILPLMDQQPALILNFMAKVAFWIFLKSALVIAVLAALDYAFQRWQYLEKMKMTKQEMKDEAKQTEGDPLVRGRIRSIQMSLARQRMMAEVPTADVIITNPTRLAIALRYEKRSMKAPTVVAKGAGIIAQRIREIAAENAVPIVEDKPLAQALFKTVEINQTIPENLYQAVAEVLAYVYSFKRKSA